MQACAIILPRSTHNSDTLGVSATGPNDPAPNAPPMLISISVVPMTRHEGARTRLDVGMPLWTDRIRRHAIKAHPMGIRDRWGDPTSVEIVGGGPSSMRRSVIHR